MVGLKAAWREARANFRKQKEDIEDRDEYKGVQVETLHCCNMVLHHCNNAIGTFQK